MHILKRHRNRAVIAHISDPQCAHELGLINPETKLQRESPDGEIYYWTPSLNAVQNHLWDLMTDDIIPRVIEFSDNDPLVVMQTGDITQGNKYVGQKISENVSDQIEISAYAHYPWYELKNLKAVRFCASTAAHSFGQAATDKQVAYKLQDKFPRISTEMIFHGLADVYGIKIDYAHHGPYHGSRDWLRGNEARYYLRDIMNSELRRHRMPPDLVLRGHYHVPVREYLSQIDGIDTNGFDQWRGSWICIAASMCGFDDHARQAARSSHELSNGIWMFEVIDGRLGVPIPIIKTIDNRTVEKIL